jgi:predicted ATPase/DNA-binding CsgD family transcriptional regulator
MAPVQPQRHRDQLPAEVTGFVGREAELAQLTSVLAHARIVTVTGYGGVGKTRLALRAAVMSALRYPDGVILLDLAQVRDPVLLLPALTAALAPVGGHASRPGDAQQDKYRERPADEVFDHAELDILLGNLSSLRLLLIWDTCEHMVEPCARLAELVLRHAAGVTILATSRQPLDVPGEYVISVPPLPVPGIAAGTDCGSAVELLAQQAASVIPGFTVTGQNRAAVIALCRRLDGIPLAIELAALRMRALPLEELTASSDDAPTRMLTGVRRTRVTRHQTIQRSIEWSRSLCTPAEHTVWTRLSVFAGSFDLAAAEAVCGGDLRAGQVTEAVIGLVDKSVLLRESPLPDPVAAPPPASLPRGQAATLTAMTQPAEPATRYRLPHAAREAGGELLTRTDDAMAVRERYVAHWTTAAERFARRIVVDQLGEYRTLRREHANLAAACKLVLQADGGADYAARLATALSMYWVIAGHLRDGRHWLDQVAIRFSRPSRERARVLAVRAHVAGAAGDIPAALTDAQTCIALATEVGDEDAHVRGSIALHRALSWRGELSEAARVANDTVPALEEAGDVLGLAQLDIQAGTALMATAPQECAEICAQALARLPATELWATGSLLAITALALYRAGNLGGATDTARRSLAIKRELGDVRGIATGIATLGFLAGDQGRHGQAALLLGAATPLWEPTGTRYAGLAFLEDLHRKTVRAALDNLGEAAYASLRQAGAAIPLDEVIALASQLDNDPDGRSPTMPWSAEVPPAAPVAPLTGREVQIAVLVASGLSNREIAERVTISKRTVDAHVDHIFTKLRISSRIQLTNWLRDRVPAVRPDQDKDERVTGPYPLTT